MPYTLTAWQDEPSLATPFSSSNLLVYNAAINDIDSRILLTQAAMSVTSVQTANYTALINQFVPVDTTAGSITITLPQSPVDQARVGIKQVVRAGSNMVIVAAAGTDTFNTPTGPVVVSLQGLNQAAIFQYVDASDVWINISDDTPLSQTTGRAIAMSMVLGAFSP